MFYAQLWYYNSGLEWNVFRFIRAWFFSLVMFANKWIILAWCIIKLVISHALNIFIWVTFYSCVDALSFKQALYDIPCFVSWGSRYYSNNSCQTYNNLQVMEVIWVMLERWSLVSILIWCVFWFSNTWTKAGVHAGTCTC